MYQAVKLYRQFGGYFFSRETMQFWGTRLVSGLYNGRFFITSEVTFDGLARRYTIRRFSPNYADVETIGEFQQYETKEEARRNVRIMSAHCRETLIRV